MRNVCVMSCQCLGRSGATARRPGPGCRAVTHRGLSMSGQALGGRRARVALVALALADGPGARRPAGRPHLGRGRPGHLARRAARGRSAGLRAALAAIGAGGQRVIATTRPGYRLAPGDRGRCARRGGGAGLGGAAGRAGPAPGRAGGGRPAAALSGERLLPGEDAAWLEPHRRELDALALRALELVAGAAGAVGDHHRAAAAARRAVAACPLDERSHRALIGALHRAGDRAGVVLAYEQCRDAARRAARRGPRARDGRRLPGRAGGAGHAGKRRGCPPATSAFFGRAAELARAGGPDRRARPGHRGGPGRHRQVEAGHPGRGRGGGVPRRPAVGAARLVAQDELVASSVALALGIRPGAEDATAQLAAALAPLGRALLILDGCEAVVDGVASAGDHAGLVLPAAVGGGHQPGPAGRGGRAGDRPGAAAGPGRAGRTAMLASLPLRLLADRVRAGGGQLDIGEEMAPVRRRAVPPVRRRAAGAGTGGRAARRDVGRPTCWITCRR